MRSIFLFLLINFSIVAKAQIVSPFNSIGFIQRPGFAQNINFSDSNTNKKWFVTHYAGISTSFSFFKGGNATIVAAPINLQLNRKINDNLYAFAGITAAPAYVNFNQRFLSTDINKFPSSNNYLRANNLGLYTRTEVGLMYVNDAKTFSISGSFGIERSTNPMFQYNNQMNVVKPNVTQHYRDTDR